VAIAGVGTAGGRVPASRSETSLHSWRDTVSHDADATSADESLTTVPPTDETHERPLPHERFAGESDLEVGLSPHLLRPGPARRVCLAAQVSESEGGEVSRLGDLAEVTEEYVARDLAARVAASTAHRLPTHRRSPSRLWKALVNPLRPLAGRRLFRCGCS